VLQVAAEEARIGLLMRSDAAVTRCLLSINRSLRSI